MREAMRKFSPGEEVDFVIVGSGAAGGVLARELSLAGFRVVVLEQGPYRHQEEFKHNEFKTIFQNELIIDWKRQPTTFRKTEQEKANVQPALMYGRLVGGGSVHFTANFWRFHEIDFIERSKRGPVTGADLADWPITYADLEPYYTKVEWEVGVSGQAGVSPFDPPRSKPYPMPPLPIKSTGALLERAARKLGLHPFPAPIAILSRNYRNRAGCVHCGYCEGFGCEMGAKSSTLASVIPEAERTGRCEIRPESYAHEIRTDAAGRATGVAYFDSKKRENFQKAKAVIVSANGAETPRLLLLSKSSLFPEGLANSSGLVGRHLMFNSFALANAQFEHALNEYKSQVVTRVVHDFYELDPKVGFCGGGGMDMRFDQMPISFALGGTPPGVPQWGAEYKAHIQQNFTRTAYVFCHATSLPVPTNSISLDPDVKDEWGLPVLRVTYKDHPDDLKTCGYLLERAMELLDVMPTRRKWKSDVREQEFGVHLLGTCRMGNDPKTSVINSDHRTHDVPNLFLCDGSSLVTSGRGQPTMTIQALAFRAADRIVRLAKRGELGAAARPSRS
ncbi:MAG TPA: GMC family oxidoreductase [Candidatus Acidoferrales bacterium]|nr:GMC family oxidoreductase [Candidatus Acidoferrales bacterium]